LCTARSSRRLLLELLRTERPQARLRRFSFRAISPLFDVHRFTLCGKPDGHIASSDGLAITKLRWQWKRVLKLIEESHPSLSLQIASPYF